MQEIARLTGECFGIDRLIIFSVETEQIHVLNEWRANNRVSSMLNHSFPISDWVDILDPACEFYSKRRFHGKRSGGVKTKQNAPMLNQTIK